MSENPGLLAAVARPVERLAYTTIEASQALGVRPCTIRRLEKTGRLAAIPGFTQKKLYRVSDIRRLVETRARPGIHADDSAQPSTSRT